MTKRTEDSKYTGLQPPKTGNAGVEEDRKYTNMPPPNPRDIDGLNRAQDAANPQTLVARLLVKDISKLDAGKKSLEDLGFSVLAASSRALTITGSPDLYSTSFGIRYQKADDGAYRVFGEAVIPETLDAYFSAVYLPTKASRFP